MIISADVARKGSAFLAASTFFGGVIPGGISQAQAAPATAVSQNATIRDLNQFENMTASQAQKEGWKKALDDVRNYELTPKQQKELFSEDAAPLTPVVGGKKDRDSRYVQGGDAQGAVDAKVEDKTIRIKPEDAPDKIDKQRAITSFFLGTAAGADIHVPTIKIGNTSLNPNPSIKAGLNNLYYRGSQDQDINTSERWQNSNTNAITNYQSAQDKVSRVRKVQGAVDRTNIGIVEGLQPAGSGALTPGDVAAAQEGAQNFYAAAVSGIAGEINPATKKPNGMALASQIVQDELRGGVLGELLGLPVDSNQSISAVKRLKAQRENNNGPDSPSR